MAKGNDPLPSEQRCMCKFRSDPLPPGDLHFPGCPEYPLPDYRTSEKRVKRPGGPRGFWSRNITDADYLTKIYSKCVMNAEGCLRWQGNKNTKGYGEMGYRNSRQIVHRLVYRLILGRIPPGMLVCHTCDVRDCCNWQHLFLGTAKDNNRDTAKKGRHHNTVKTHCPKGHPYDLANTYITPAGLRNCRACSRERQRRYDQEKRYERRKMPAHLK
jgi:HNH endonuclease